MSVLEHVRGRLVHVRLADLLAAPPEYFVRRAVFTADGLPPPLGVYGEITGVCFRLNADALVWHAQRPGRMAATLAAGVPGTDWIPSYHGPQREFLLWVLPRRLRQLPAADENAWMSSLPPVSVLLGDLPGTDAGDAEVGSSSAQAPSCGPWPGVADIFCATWGTRRIPWASQMAESTSVHSQLRFPVPSRRALDDLLGWSAACQGWRQQTRRQRLWLATTVTRTVRSPSPEESDPESVRTSSHRTKVCAESVAPSVPGQSQRTTCFFFCVWCVAVALRESRKQQRSRTGSAPAAVKRRRGVRRWAMSMDQAVPSAQPGSAAGGGPANEAAAGGGGAFPPAPSALLSMIQWLLRSLGQALAGQSLEAHHPLTVWRNLDPVTLMDRIMEIKEETTEIATWVVLRNRWEPDRIGVPAPAMSWTTPSVSWKRCPRTPRG